jgi:hypothetical protein
MPVYNIAFDVMVQALDRVSVMPICARVHRG